VLDSSGRSEICALDETLLPHEPQSSSLNAPASYGGVGVREIAQGAGVTAMLVNRYFGSKEQLFAEVVQVACADKGILTQGVTKPDRNLKTFNQDVAGALVGKTTLGAAHSTASCSC